MSQSSVSGNLFSAAKQLADSELQLIKVIENSTVDNTSAMPMPRKKNTKKSAKMTNIRPSAALLAAKQEAVQRQTLQSKKSSNIFVDDIYQKVIDSQSVTRKMTGVVLDYSMVEHECLWDTSYPECPARLIRVLQRCNELELLNRCKLIESRLSTENEILTKHDQKHIAMLKETDGCRNMEKLETLSSKYDAIFIHPSTYKLSLLAVGSTIKLVETICKGDVQNGMAIIRPPGHHAMKSEYCGYCFFNNVAISAEKALNSNWASKILIVDWDVHHGQATQQMFYNDPRVVYFSIHRYEHGKFWPNLPESNFHYIGEGAGEGYNFNIPLNEIGMTNADYIAIFQQVLLPMAYEFQPDLVIISAGYDAAIGCPEGQMEVTPACYAHLLSSLLSLAAGRIAVVLEGGYCLKSLAEGAALTLRTLLDDPCPMLQSLEVPSLSIRDTILNTIYAHKQYWKCYQYQDLYSINSTNNKKEEKKSHYLPTVTYQGNLYKPTIYETRNCYPVQNKEIFEALDRKINALIEFTNLRKATNKVCIVYDDRMLIHCNVSDRTHPEKPTRISSIYKKHEEYDLLQRCCLRQGRIATEEEILLVHSKHYIDAIKKTRNLKLRELEKQAADYNSVYFHNETWLNACISAGSLLQVVDSVLSGESQSGVAIVRPPGHHAEQDVACGFCIFNNIAIAAKYAMKSYNIKRILIVDWDVHHGNGTQSIFENDPSVLYISVHRYDNGNFFPNSKEGNYIFVGTEGGTGYTVNIPWNKKGMGNAEYIAAFQQIVMPIAYQFNPELILISAGFDACIGDPLGGCVVTPELYGHLTHWLSSLANGRLILSLEGGYNINSISHAMIMCTKALLGDPLPILDSYQIPCSSAIHSIINVLKVQKLYWPNLMFNMSLPKENVIPKATESYTKSNEQTRDTEISKIALEGIENEKLNLNFTFDKNYPNLVTDEEILKLQNEVENIKIKNSETLDVMKINQNMEYKLSNIHESDIHIFNDSQCIRKCVNQGKESREKKQDCGNTPNNSDETGNSYGEATGGADHSSTLMGYLSENLQALITGEMFAVIPLRDCPHLDTIREVPSTGIDVRLPCSECGSNVENWVCLECYSVNCARNINQHAIFHAEQVQHPITLSFSDLSVWCYGCESYIDNPRLYSARNAVHQSKFNTPLPWTYDTSPTAN